MRYRMAFSVALVLGGSIVYLANGDAGALMIAAGCAIEVVRFADRVTRRWWTRAKAGGGLRIE